MYKGDEMIEPRLETRLLELLSNFNNGEFVFAVMTQKDVELRLNHHQKSIL